MQNVMQQLAEHLNQRIVGQRLLMERLLIALLADGHLLVEGAPGLAKTKAIKELAACIEGDFHRIQFTPDLLPGDLTGTDVYRPETGTFHFQQGPLFHNLLLADEINRAPAKVQSALLEAMAERQITIGQQTYQLPQLFLVMATQNPIEQEGTYPLPEAQLDRFLMYVKIDYPASDAERQILALATQEAKQGPSNVDKCGEVQIDQQTIFNIRRQVLDVHISEPLQEYLIQLIMATRHIQSYGEDLAKWLRYGASPRATIALDRCAKAHAWLAGQDYVAPDNIHAVIHDILRHRLLLTFEAEAEGVTSDDVIAEILQRVAIP
jgi:MoxR-like ATPase